MEKANKRIIPTTKKKPENGFKNKNSNPLIKRLINPITNKIL
jgi:hypothetical protein